MQLHQFKCSLDILYANHLSELRVQQQISLSICCVVWLMIVEAFTSPCRQRFLTASWLFGNRVFLCFVLFFLKSLLNTAPLKVCQRQSIFNQTNKWNRKHFILHKKCSMQTLQKWYGWAQEHHETVHDDETAPEMKTLQSRSYGRREDNSVNHDNPTLVLFWSEKM